MTRSGGESECLFERRVGYLFSDFLLSLLSALGLLSFLAESLLSESLLEESLAAESLEEESLDEDSPSESEEDEDEAEVPDFLA